MCVLQAIYTLSIKGRFCLHSDAPAFRSPQRSGLSDTSYWLDPELTRLGKLNSSILFKLELRVEF